MTDNCSYNSTKPADPIGKLLTSITSWQQPPEARRPALSYMIGDRAPFSRGRASHDGSDEQHVAAQDLKPEPSSSDDTEGGDSMSDEHSKRLHRRVVLKTDLALLPLMGLTVLLQYLDKAILSYAALLGLVKDLRLTGTEYSWAASTYYFGLMAGLPLWTFALQRVTPDRVTGVAVISWGIICMCHAATHNYAQILAVRFLLGSFEAAVTPTFIIVVGQFYTKKETISRTAVWYSANGFALILGGSMSYGLLTNSSSLSSSLAVWRQLYLILGGITIAIGIWALFGMPSIPSKTRLFTAEERKVALARVTTRPGHAVKELFSKKLWSQSYEALFDPRIYIIFLGLTLGSIPTGGVTAFSLQILAGFGFQVQESLLLTLAPGGAQIISVILFIASSTLAKSRAIGGLVLVIIAVIGSGLMYSPSLGRATHVVGYCLLNMGSPAVVALYSFNSAAVGGHGKRVIFATVSQFAYAAGNM